MSRNTRIGLDLLVITLGCALYGFGLVYINIANHLAEGGVTGITLLIRYWWGLDPAYSTDLLNIPLLIVGYKFGQACFSLYHLWNFDVICLVVDLATGALKH